MRCEVHCGGYKKFGKSKKISEHKITKRQCSLKCAMNPKPLWLCLPVFHRSVPLPLWFSNAQRTHFALHMRTTKHQQMLPVAIQLQFRIVGREELKWFSWVYSKFSTLTKPQWFNYGKQTLSILSSVWKCQSSESLTLSMLECSIFFKVDVRVTNLIFTQWIQQILTWD